MGCGGSTRKEKKTDFEMEKIGSSDADSIFEEPAQVFQTLAGVYKKVSKPLRHLKEKTGAIAITQVKSEEVIQIMLYDFSAACDGDLDKIDLKPDDDAPYLKVKKSSLNHECVEIFEAFEKLVEHTAEAAQELPNLQDQVQTALQGLEELPNRANSALDDLGAMEKIKAVKKVTANVAKLKKGGALLELLQKTLSELGKSFQELPKCLDSPQVDQIKQVGKAAHSAHHTKPLEVVQHHVPMKDRFDANLLKPKAHHK